MIFRTLLLSLFLTLGNGLMAQEWEKEAFVNTQAYFIDNAERLMLRPGVGLTKGYHHIRLAPAFRLYSTEAGYDPGGFQITGGMAAYQFSIPTVFEKLHLYFLYELNYHLYRNDWQSNLYNPEEQVYQNMSYETTEHFIANSLGMGFKVFLGEDFSLALDVSEGVFLSDIQVKNLPTNLQQVENFDFREYGDKGFVFSTSFTLAYQF